LKHRSINQSVQLYSLRSTPSVQQIFARLGFKNFPEISEHFHGVQQTAEHSVLAACEPAGNRRKVIGYRCSLVHSFSTPFSCTGTPSLSSTHLSLDYIKRKEKTNRDIYPRLSRCFLSTHAYASAPHAPVHAHSFPFPSHPHACAMPPSHGVSSNHLCRGRLQQRWTGVVGEHARWCKCNQPLKWVLIMLTR